MHCRYYQIAGVTLQVESELPFHDTTFDPKFRIFETGAPGDDVITLHHYFRMPEGELLHSGKEIYSRPPWRIRQNGDQWIYLKSAGDIRNPSLEHAAVFRQDYRHGDLFSSASGAFEAGGLHSLTLFPTDQILLGSVLAARRACILHASGVLLKGRGLLFVGHSEAGKSTIARMLQGRCEILCDDRMIVRRWPDAFRIHGSWSHGEIPAISAAAAPLTAAFFLKQSNRNQLIPVDSRREILGGVLSCLIRPLCTADWWNRMLALADVLAREVPFYTLEFDKSGRIADILEELPTTP